MEEKIADFVKQYKLGQKEPVVLAVSGGVDSVALLDLLSKYVSKDKLVVVHVNHGLRKESDEEEKFVRDLVKKYDLAFYVKKLRLKSKSEDTARRERYKFLRLLKNKIGAKYIITAHHLNDQVETVLLNLTRGSGPLDVWGMKESENDILRPLLPFPKSEILAFAKRKKLQHLEDPSNKDLSFARNRIRHKVIPELEKINLNFLSTLQANIELAKEANEIIEKKLQAAMGSAVSGNDVDLRKFKRCDIFIQKEIIRRMLFAMTGKKEGIYFRNIEEVLKLAKSAGTKITKIGSFTIGKNCDKIIFGQLPKKCPKSIKIIPGKTQRFGKFIFESGFGQEKTRKNNILLGREIAYNLGVRTWKAGDRIKTASGTKKLQDVFTDGKISLSERKTWPVVVYKSKVVWVPLLAAGQEYLTKDKKALILKVKNAG